MLGSGRDRAPDGGGSRDADSRPGTHDDIVSFEWFRDFGLPGQRSLGGGESIQAFLPYGSNRITLVVTDSQGETGRSDLEVRVADTTPPVLSCPETVTGECASPEGATMPLRASASDSCDGILSVVNDRTGTGPDASGTYPLGTTPVEFRATDAAGNAATCRTEVVVTDTSPPRITAFPVPAILWPPNHQMIGVEVQISSADSCGAAAVRLVSVSSSEPDDAPGVGDGNTTRDIQEAATGEADVSLRLRAERDGNGPGRIYRITYEAADGSGNRALVDATVLVPHDQGGVADPVSVAASQEGDRTLFYWSPVPGAVSYTMVRGMVSNLRDDADAIDLGAVACVQAGMAGADPTLREDRAVPEPGEAFCYLVAYDDGNLSSTYGSSGATKPRTVSSGDCQALGSPAASPGGGDDPARRPVLRSP